MLDLAVSRDRPGRCRCQLGRHCPLLPIRVLAFPIGRGRPASRRRSSGRHMMRPSVWTPPPMMEEETDPDALGAVAAEAGLADRPMRTATPAAAATARAAIR